MTELPTRTELAGLLTDAQRLNAALDALDGCVEAWRGEQGIGLPVRAYGETWTPETVDDWGGVLAESVGLALRETAGVVGQIELASTALGELRA